MITLIPGTRVVADIDGVSCRHPGVIASVDDDVIIVRLDEQQPPAGTRPVTGVDLMVDAEAGLILLRTYLCDIQTGGQTLRVVKPLAIVRGEGDDASRLPMSNTLLWSELSDDGSLTAHRQGVVRDISLSEIRFETLVSPPEAGAIVAFAGVDPQQVNVVQALVLTVEEMSSQRLRHTVQCGLKLAGGHAAADLTDLIAAAQSTPAFSRPQHSGSEPAYEFDLRRLGKMG